MPEGRGQGQRRGHRLVPTPRRAAARQRHHAVRRRCSTGICRRVSRTSAASATATRSAGSPTTRRLMARELGDRVTMWSTFNEPWCYAYLGHVAGYHAPGLTDPKAGVTVAHHEQLAHGLALQAMRAERDGLQLGIVINPSNVRSEGSPAADADEMRKIDAHPQPVVVRLDPEGRLPRRHHSTTSGRSPRPSSTATSRRSPSRSTGSGSTTTSTSSSAACRPTTPAPTGCGRTPPSSAPPKPTTGPCTPTWAGRSHPTGFTELLVRLHTDYPNMPPIYITENGCAYDDPVIDGRCADPRRIEYLDLHLRAVKDAIDEGVDIRGYYQWSLMDNFEWALGLCQALRPRARRFRHTRTHTEGLGPLVSRGHQAQRARSRRMIRIRTASRPSLAQATTVSSS